MEIANSNAKEIQLIATIIRADGTVEPLGIVDYYHRNPLKMFIWKVKQFIKGL